LSAIAAIATVVLSIIGYNAVTGRDDDPPESAVVLTGTQVGPDGLAYEGEYRALRVGLEEIFVMARPSADAPPHEWVHVAAQRTATRADAEAGTEDGRWRAELPIGQITEDWLVEYAIVRAGLQGVGSSDALEELRREGPDASVVIRSGETQVATPDASTP
jgi:hypothetical protein